MIKILSVFLVTLFSFQSGFTQEFSFPDTRMGTFAGEWFNWINKADTSVFKYDSEKFWRDYFGDLRSLAKIKQGIFPVMISYETENELSVYSKEKTGGWVKVNLTLSRNSEILAMGIKKTFTPNISENYRDLNINVIREVVSEISNVLKTEYVNENLGKEYAGYLLSKAESGYFDEFTQADLLANILTRELQSYSGDKHLELISTTQQMAVIERFGTEKPQNLRLAAPFQELKTPGNSHRSESVELELSEKSGEFIFGELTDAGTGIITFERFVGDSSGIIQIEKVFSRVTKSNRIIIDLRSSGGGDGAAVDRILDILNREIFRDKKLAVLTSSKTISAGESLAYRVKRENKGIVIGEKTAGAGYLVNVFDVGHGFNFVNSTHTTFKDGGGWQGTGVLPDFLISASDALEKALEKLTTK